MKKLWDKKPVLFAVIWIVLYVMGTGTMQNLTDDPAKNYLAVIELNSVFAAILLIFAKRHELLKSWFLQGFRGGWKRVLYFLPLFAAMTENLWHGFGHREDTPAATVCGVLAIGILAPFMEELIFRGILFRAIGRTSARRAFWWAALGFGIGHAVNLLFGKGGMETALQLVYASCIGFAFAAAVLAGRSLIPTTIGHMLCNSLSFFARQEETLTSSHIAGIAVMCLICVVYGIYLLKVSDRKLTSAPLPEEE
ncbi:MAG: CPBP family intramembrane metalloprotease [Oscillospiraceae bacterium]|nr:CPBP family intramembrane metalloprotease [Oscillospiraceae bacterium]